MNEYLQKFLEYASGNEDVRQKLDALNDGRDKESVISGAIEIARESGFALSADDFAPEIGELSDDDLDAVAGGESCGCALGGGGTYSDAFYSGRVLVENLTCACVLGGGGETKYTDMYSTKSKKKARCACVVGGGGSDKQGDVTVFF